MCNDNKSMSAQLQSCLSIVKTNGSQDLWLQATTWA